MDFEEIIVSRKNKTVYRNGNTVVKVFEKGHNKGNIFAEAVNTARMEECGVPAARVISVGELGDRHAITLERIEGQTLEELMQAHPEKMDEYLNTFVDLQLSIHQKNCLLLTDLKAKYRRMIEGMTDIGDNTKYEILTRLDGMKSHNKICHGDFNPSNVIITKDNKAYVVDWSHTTKGNASADAAMTYLIFALKDQALADKYLDLFSEKSGIEKKNVQIWLSIVAAAQLSKGVEEEAEFLKKWMDVFDFQ